MVLKVAPKLINRLIPALRFFAKANLQDGIDIARQLAARALDPGVGGSGAGAALKRGATYRMEQCCRGVLTGPATLLLSSGVVVRPWAFGGPGQRDRVRVDNRRRSRLRQADRNRGTWRSDRTGPIPPGQLSGQLSGRQWPSQ